MSKKRAAAKYLAVGAVSAAYVGATVRLVQSPPKDGQVTRRQVAIVAGMMLALTWTATLL